MIDGFGTHAPATHELPLWQSLMAAHFGRHKLSLGSAEAEQAVVLAAADAQIADASML
jgi:hypothetical protein